MRFPIFIALITFASPVLAQDATPLPKKDPFAGFGKTAIDQRPSSARMASPPLDVSSLPSRNSALSRGNSAPVSSGLTFEAKTVSNGGGVAAGGAPIVAGRAVPKVETRASHPVLQVTIRNLAKQPESAHFDWYFVASDLNGRGRYVWDRGERDVSLPAGGDQTEMMESKAVEQRTITESRVQVVTSTISNGSTQTQNQTISTQKRVGSRPDGWIVRMFVGGVLVKVQASTTVFEQIGRDPASLDQLLKMKPPLQ